MKLMAKNAEERSDKAWGIKANLERCVHQLETTGQIDHIQLGLQDVCDQFQIPQKLYGREAEIEALLTVFEKVANMRNVGETYDQTKPSATCLHNSFRIHTPTFLITFLESCATIM